jgi:drug/metabolite transporter (DMT)-like permease
MLSTAASLVVRRCLWAGERLRPLQLGGLVLACGGLVGLVLPGLSAPPLTAALLMIMAGTA